MRTTVSTTNIPISPTAYPVGRLNHRNEGSLLDADHPHNGVLFARRSTLEGRSIRLVVDAPHWLGVPVQWGNVTVGTFESSGG